MDTICARPRSASACAEVAELAGRAVLSELLLTPKPGLVDRRNSGAHRDMDFRTFLTSASAIAPWWQRFVQKGHETAHMPASALLAQVRPTGVLCEQAMFLATKGVNTHKGAIFSLGLLCFAAGRLLAQGALLTRARLCKEVARICAGIVERELGGSNLASTAGERVFQRYGLSGARGEAASGFALVRASALPVYDSLRRQPFGDEVALLQVLLHLLAVNADTNLLSRGGLEGLEYVRGQATRLLREGGALELGGEQRMEEFDDALIARRLSPGGSADLLGVTWFLARLPELTAAARLFLRDNDVVSDEPSAL